MPSRSRRPLLVAPLLALLVGCARPSAGPPGAGGVGPHVAGAGGPRVVFASTSYVGPDVAGHIRNRFDFRNAGDAPLKITKVTASCGCTATTVKDQVVAPGASSFIEADMAVIPSRRQSSVIVETNDPKDPAVTLVLMASGAPPNNLDFLPSSLRLRGTGSDPVRGRCVLRLTSWRANPERVNLDELALVTSDPLFTIRASTSPARPGEILGWGPAGVARQPNGWYRSDTLPDRTVWFRVFDYEIRPGTPPGLARYAVRAHLADETKTLSGLLLVTVERDSPGVPDPQPVNPSR